METEARGNGPLRGKDTTSHLVVFQGHAELTPNLAVTHQCDLQNNSGREARSHRHINPLCQSRRVVSNTPLPSRGLPGLQALVRAWGIPRPHQPSTSQGKTQQASLCWRCSRRLVPPGFAEYA
eukprot:1175826-Prorocentrum_minimum.AAC.2